jgi:parvulin-like peptidyl-prolyl isomerase
MIRNIFIAAVFIFTAAAAAAQPKKMLADKIVAVVGDKVILKSDVDNNILDMQRQGMEVPPNARCLVLEQAMGIKALVLHRGTGEDRREIRLSVKRRFQRRFQGSKIGYGNA